MKRWRAEALLLAACLLYASLAVSSLREKSITFDECAYLPAGYTYWRLGDYRLNPEHPPLVKLLAAVPLLFMDVTVHEDSAGWALKRQWDFGHHFLFDWNDADRLLFWGRVPIVALGCLMACAVFSWARRRWGLPAASLALFLCVLSPDMLAHGQVVAFDLGAALFYFLTVVAFERVCERVTAARVLVAGLSLGAALATKSTALALLPLLGALAVVAALTREPASEGAPAEPRPLRSRLLPLAVVLVAMGVTACVVIWAAHGFHSRISPDPAVEASIDWGRNWPEGALTARLASLARGAGVLPEAYLYGVMKVLKHAEARPAFLAGRHSQEGWWYYYPTTIALKTPLPLLILLALSLATRRRHAVSWRAESFLWLPVLLYLGLAMTSSIDIGHRYLLPIYPFLFVAAGRSAAWAASASWRSAAGIVVLALAAWYAVGTARIHPHYLAYFNELAGGPQNGYRYLVDSNLDWGQDLKGLKRYLDRQGLGRIKLAYFGTGDPRYYGIDCDLLPGYMLPPPKQVTRDVSPGDVLAVSATLLQGVYLEEPMQPLMEKLRARSPLGAVGYSIFVYRADFAWSPP